MRSHRMAAIALALFIVAPRAHAQDSTAFHGDYLIGAGVNVLGGERGGLALQLGREWSSPASRFSLRLAGGYTYTTTGTEYLYTYTTDIQPMGTFHEDAHDFSVGLLTSFALTKGRVQPYLISGLMLHDIVTRARLEANPSYVQSSSMDLPPYQSHDDRAANLSLGMEAGVGVRARVGGATVYTEFRNVAPSIGSGFQPRVNRPLTVGIHF